MFVSTMEGPTLKDRPGMLVVIRNVSVMMEEQVITPATKGISYFIQKSFSFPLSLSLILSLCLSLSLFLFLNNLCYCAVKFLTLEFYIKVYLTFTVKLYKSLLFYLPL